MLFNEIKGDGHISLVISPLRAILCKDQRTIKVLRNGMSQNMLIFTSYVSYGILNSNIDMKIEKENRVDMATNSRFSPYLSIQSYSKSHFLHNFNTLTYKICQ